MSKDVSAFFITKTFNIMEQDLFTLNVLHLCVCDESWVPPQYKGDYHSVPRDELDRNSGWYLHGELENLVGYDKAYTTNCKTMGHSRQSLDWHVIRGHEAEVHDPDHPYRWGMYVNDIIPVQVQGVDEPCVGYFWTVDEPPITWHGQEFPLWCQRGLVCLESDTPARLYAGRKYQERAWSL